MGRRALPKVDTDLDFSSNFRNVDEFPRAWELQALFSAPNQPLEFEIGSGKGLFLTSAALDYPERNFLGVEIAGKYARFAASQLAKHNLTNAMVLRGDGVAFLKEHPPDAAFSAVHVYFPDPWWKRRHRKRRVVNEPFLTQAIRTLRDGGELHLWTDVEEYFEASLRLIGKFAALDGPHPVDAAAPEHDMDYRTHFERRTRMLELPVHRALYRRRPRG